MELSKEDARAIWLQKYYFRDRFEFNYYVLEYPLPKKIVEYKESVIILDGGIYSPWIGFQSKEEYDYLADLSGIDSYVSKSGVRLFPYYLLAYIMPPLYKP